jgi:hypothetical protein
VRAFCLGYTSACSVLAPSLVSITGIHDLSCLFSSLFCPSVRSARPDHLLLGLGLSNTAWRPNQRPTSTSQSRHESADTKNNPYQRPTCASSMSLFLCRTQPRRSQAIRSLRIDIRILGRMLIALTFYSTVHFSLVTTALDPPRICINPSQRDRRVPHKAVRKNAHLINVPVSIDIPHPLTHLIPT